MENSILKSVKHNLGLAEDYTVFDFDIMTFINGVFVTLNDLGIGPAEGFMIESDEPTWDAFLGASPLQNSVKTYMYLRVRMLFDPPTTSYLIDAMQEQVKEHEWRINTRREKVEWVDPDPPLFPAL